MIKRITIKSGFAAVAAGAMLVGMAAPSFAETRPGTSVPSTAGPAAEVKDKRYCVEQMSTGSRIARKVCKTRAQWMDEGFDPLDQK